MPPRDRYYAEPDATRTVVGDGVGHSGRVYDPQVLPTKEQLLDMGKRVIPIYGSYLAGKDLYEHPSLENAAWFGLSLLSEIPIFKGLGAIGRVGKTFKTLRAISPTYTGMDAIKYSRFPNWHERSIWTTDNLLMAKNYSHAKLGNADEIIPSGGVYKVYDMDRGANTIKIPDAPEGYAYMKTKIPYKVKMNGEVKPLLKITEKDLMSKSDFEKYYNTELQDYHPDIHPQIQEGIKGVVHPRIGDTLDDMNRALYFDSNKYTGLLINNVLDNVLWDGENSIMPIMKEIIYKPGANLIKAPLDEQILKTAIRVNQNYLPRWQDWLVPKAGLIIGSSSNEL